MITKQDVVELLAPTKGAVMAQIEMVTDVPLSAANKKAGVVIKKYTTASVILFNNLKDADPYLNKVNKTKTGEGDFEKSESFFQHDDKCYSLVTHKEKGTEYLFLVFNDSKSLFWLDNKTIIERTEVANYMTPSGAKTLLDDSGIVYNKKNDCEHSAIVRTVKLENVEIIKTNGKIISA